MTRAQAWKSEQFCNSRVFSRRPAIEIVTKQFRIFFFGAKKKAPLIKVQVQIRTYKTISHEPI